MIDKFQSNCCGFWPDSMILAYRLINIHQREKLRVNFKSMTEVIIENAIHYIEELFRKNAGGHDSSHTILHVITPHTDAGILPGSRSGTGSAGGSAGSFQPRVFENTSLSILAMQYPMQGPCFA